VMKFGIAGERDAPGLTWMRLRRSAIQHDADLHAASPGSDLQDLLSATARPLRVDKDILVFNRREILRLKPSADYVPGSHLAKKPSRLRNLLAVDCLTARGVTAAARHHVFSIASRRHALAMRRAGERSGASAAAGRLEDLVGPFRDMLHASYWIRRASRLVAGDGGHPCAC